MTKFSKYILSIVFLIILFIQYFTFIKNNNNTVSVFNQNKNQTNNEFNYYELTFKNGINIKNMKNYFSKLKSNEYKINIVTPKINPAWNNNLKENLESIEYTSIDKLFKYYLNCLEEYHLDEEINNTKIYGIEIEKLVIYTSNKNIKLLKASDNNLEYKQK